jgi:hypothetical protein
MTYDQANQIITMLGVFMSITLMIGFGTTLMLCRIERHLIDLFDEETEENEEDEE